MMTTTQDGAKALPRQPKWNAGGAIGVLAGLLLSSALPADLFWDPAFGPQNHAWAVTLGASAILGACVGMLVGGILDRVERHASRRRAP